MLLEIRDLRVKYGNVEVLHGVNLSVGEGEIVAILGANGAGKSTTLMAVSRIVKSSAGTIEFNGKALHRLKAHDVVREGVIQVPEGRRIFNTLTVDENLALGAFVREDAARISKTRGWIYDLFPILKERRDQLGGTLSGGEQQMLAIARGLMAEPKILLLDEPSLGLAPLLVKAIFRTLAEINKAGVTIVLVEQNAKAALRLANRGYILEVGNVVLEDSAAGLLENPEVRKAYLGG
ncbi:MAG: ABC transporter ATP-binding protein [Pseudomonadota bacterium]|jgi:branched-chain amino acid transport system ATP-binding protein|nr:ABC transporter ATP-binding protein [Pseudomonadota bacterium]OPY05201.1 MAG: High-affinity branched-chain amino acid transport ATP-binding protein LivF [Syntrophaceae bacterium PtaB.Bin038]